MKYQLHVASSAQSDLETILDWIAERSIDGAVKWVDAYEQMLDRLIDHPFAHSFAPENDHIEDKVVRNALFGTSRGRVFRALYYVQDDVVTITHLRGPHQRTLSNDELRRI